MTTPIVCILCGLPINGGCPHFDHAFREVFTEPEPARMATVERARTDGDGCEVP